MKLEETMRWETGMIVNRPPKCGSGTAKIVSIEADKRHVWISWEDRKGNMKYHQVRSDHITVATENS